MMKLRPHQHAALESLKAAGKLMTADALLFAPPPRRIKIARPVEAGTSYRTLPGEDPTAIAEEFIRQGREIDHIDEDGVITFVAETSGDCPADVPRDKSGTVPGQDRGLNTDDFSQTPTIDADRSAAWNRKAKTVKPGSFAARRMAAEE